MTVGLKTNDKNDRAARPSRRRESRRPTGSRFLSGLAALLFAAAIVPAPAALAQQAIATAGPDRSGASVGPASPRDPATHDTAVRARDVVGNPASEVPGKDKLPDAAPAYQRMKPTADVGMPTADAYYLQKQYSPLGEYAHWIHNVVLMPVMVVISVLVLALLAWVVVRYNRRANPVASRTSHNTAIEVIWTLLPVLILVGIAIPSIDLLAKQYKPAPAKALTIKVTGNQWFWTYSYPDNGGFELTSYMLNLPGQPVINNGVRNLGTDPSDGPSHLEVDNRMVVPAGEPIRLQVTAADVIHSFAVPSLWFKLDGVPGRINEKVLFIEKPGVYYGQCSELCGAKHGYMPIAVEALPRAQYNAWVLSQSGGVIDGQKPAAPAPAPSAAASAVPEAGASAASSDGPGAAPGAGASAAASGAPAAAASAAAQPSAKPAA